MNGSYENFFYFDTDSIVKEDSLVKCPECNKWTVASIWHHTITFCDICGEHEALMCPECYEVFDHAYDESKWMVK